ncbi:MAG TPA: hypothetical protein VFH08_15555, partial [Chitinophagaceae bacterium]|nr:hypothetical protein [Chitinophagaceae bacterium]
MKKINFAGMAVSTIVFVQLAIFFSSCQKEASVIKEKAAEEFTTQSVNSNANALQHTKQYPADVATGWFNLLADITRTKPYFV